MLESYLKIVGVFVLTKFKLHSLVNRFLRHFGSMLDIDRSWAMKSILSKNVDGIFSRNFENNFAGFAKIGNSKKAFLHEIIKLVGSIFSD